MGERKSKHGSQKQYICDQLARMRENGSAFLDLGASRFLIGPVGGNENEEVFVVRCKRGYAIASVNDKDTGSRLKATTQVGDVFFISQKDLLASVKKVY